MEFRVEERAACRVAGLKHVGPYSQIGAAFGRLETWLSSEQIEATGPSMGLYLRDPKSTAPEQLLSYAVVPVASNFSTDFPEVDVMELEGGRNAVAEFVGFYDGLADAWGTLLNTSIPGENLKIDWSRPSAESYVKLCLDGAQPEDILTELIQPVM